MVCAGFSFVCRSEVALLGIVKRKEKTEEKLRAVNLMKESYDRYIGRDYDDPDGRGKFGNPVACNRVCPVCGEIHRTKGSTLPCYSKCLNDRIRKDKAFRKAVRKLNGKRLGCYCKPNPCHGDILVLAVLKLQKTKRKKQP